MKWSFKKLKAIDDCFRGMNNLRRWTEFFQATRYNELAKQSLNWIVAFMIAVECEHSGKQIQWDRFPKIGIFRGFQKMGLADVTHCTYANIVENKLGKQLEDFYQVVGQKKIKDMVADEKEAEELESFLLDGSNTYEFEIFKLACRIATLVEVIENKSKFDTTEFAKKYAEIVNSIEETIKSMPEAARIADQNSPEFKLIRKISTLRNQNRWAVRSYRVNCSVLGHLFDTAVFAYIIALNFGLDEDVAAKMFFIGIWHDIAEAWTKDIPSPTKDAFVGFRDASEEFELECLQKYIYDLVAPHIRDAIKAVMLEEAANKEYKALMKAADYLSADSECWRQLVAGSRDEYFRNVLLSDYEKANILYIIGALKELMVFWYSQAKLLILFS